MTEERLKDLKVQVENLSRNVGAFIIEKRKSSFVVDEKSFNNLVTEVDKLAEEQFVAGLKSFFPEAGFIAEEGSGEKSEGGYNWIIDPIDGTTNFVHNVPLYCTSVALQYNNEIVLGVIYNPNNAELFSAAKGQGAFLNGQPISVSNTVELIESLIATGFPYDDFNREENYFKVLQTFTHKTRGIRRLGSAALDLAYVACGRFESFYEYGLNPWDVAAGVVLVKEAGGVCTNFNGGDDVVFSEEIVASNKQVHDRMLQTIAQAFTPAPSVEASN